MNPVREAMLWASENAALARRLPRWRFVQRTVSRFMPGETAEDAIAAAKGLAAEGIPATFTSLGEKVADLGQATVAGGEYLRLLDRIDALGIDAEISVKLTQLGYDLDREHAGMQVRRLAERSGMLDRTTWIDMESVGYVEGTIDLYEDLLRDGFDVGLCLQAYLRRTWDDVQRLLPLRPAVRLVKGAYKESAQHVFTDRRVIDEAYVRLALHLADDPERRVRRTVLGTHDLSIVQRVERALGADARSRFEVAMLFGIRADDQRRLAREGYAIRTLVSYGDHWYPWFMRRLAEKPLENTMLALRNLL
ncbi:MAG: proline dehydrogenase family protein [Actinomycetota bacterium]|nr:proline dehydrogenase family protein [Actinomycetota bacterium]